MKFGEVKTGMTFFANIGGEYGKKYWFVYRRDNNSLYTILFRSNKSEEDRIVKVEITKEIWHDHEYHWGDDAETVDTITLIRYKKKIIPAIFEEL